VLLTLLVEEEADDPEPYLFVNTPKQRCPTTTITTTTMAAVVEATAEEEAEAGDETSIPVLAVMDEEVMSTAVLGVKRAVMEAEGMSMVVAAGDDRSTVVEDDRNTEVVDGKNMAKEEMADTEVEVIHTVVAVRSMAVVEEGDTAAETHMARADIMDATVKEEEEAAAASVGEEADKTNTAPPAATTAVDTAAAEEIPTAEIKAVNMVASSTRRAHPTAAAAHTAA